MIIFLKKRLLTNACKVFFVVAASFCLGGVALSETSLPVKNTPAVTYSNPYFKGTREEKEAQIRRMTVLFGVDCDFCHNEDLTVFSKEGERSKVMMKASVALGVECNHCHKDLKHYQENELQAKRMFELCDIMGTECSFCHAGKDRLTQKGERSKTAFLTRAWTTEGTRPCLECHVEKKQFALNFYGWQVLMTMKGF